MVTYGICNIQVYGMRRHCSISKSYGGRQETENPIFQYSAYATSKAAAINIKNALKRLLCDYKGALSPEIAIDSIDITTHDSEGKFMEMMG